MTGPLFVSGYGVFRGFEVESTDYCDSTKEIFDNKGLNKLGTKSGIKSGMHLRKVQINQVATTFYWCEIIDAMM